MANQDWYDYEANDETSGRKRLAPKPPPLRLRPPSGSVRQSPFFFLVIFIFSAVTLAVGLPVGLGVTSIADVRGSRRQVARLSVRRFLDRGRGSPDQADREDLWIRIHSGRFVDRRSSQRHVVVAVRTTVAPSVSQLAEFISNQVPIK